MNRDITQELSSITTIPQEDGTQTDTSVGVAIKTILVVDLVDRTSLFELLGDERAFDVLERHDEKLRELADLHEGRELEVADGFFLLFDQPVDALSCALAYHDGLEQMSREEKVAIRARAGLHLGELFVRINPQEDVSQGAKPVEVEGYSKLIAIRAMELARPGQTLLTREVHDFSRGFAAEGSGLVAASHGPYLFRGVPNEVEVYEIGRPGHAPLKRPRNCATAQRIPPAASKARGLVAALVLGALLVAGLGILRLFQSTRSKPVIAVLGFENLSQRPGDAWLETAVSELLTTELGTSGDLRLIPGESIARLRRDLQLDVKTRLTPQTRRAIREYLGNDYVIVGNYMMLLPEGNFLLNVHIQSTVDDTELSSIEARGQEHELFELVSKIGADVRQRLQVGARSTPEEEKVKAMVSADERALELYFTGLSLLRDLNALEAREVLEQALAADPEYALAHSALSEAYLALGYDRKAQDSARRAYELADELPEDEKLLIEGRFHEASYAWREAVETYGELWQRRPDSLEYGLLLAKAQNHADPTQALATITALRRLEPPLGEDPRLDLLEVDIGRQQSDLSRLLSASRRAVEKGNERKAWTFVADALIYEGYAYSVTGAHDEEQAVYREAQRLFERTDDRRGVARALNAQAVLMDNLSRLDDCETLYQEALGLYQEVGYQKGVSQVLHNLALLVQERGELRLARQFLDRSLEINREIDDRAGLGYRLDALGGILLDLGELDEAGRAAEDAHTAYATMGDRSGVAWADYLLGEISFQRGELAEAEGRYRQVLAALPQVPNQELAARLAAAQGVLFLARGDLPAARREIEKALGLLREAELERLVIRAELSLADLELAAGRHERALELARQVLAAPSAAWQLDVRRNARVLSARALLARGELEEARGTLASGEEAREESQNPRLRLLSHLTEARLLAAAGDRAAGLGKCSQVRDAAAGLGMARVELEAKLASGEIRGDAEELAAVAELAAEKGYGTIARRARDAVRR